MIFFFYSRFPKYSEEYLILGSQPLTALRDAITCINDCYCHMDMSENPDPELYKQVPNMEVSFELSSIMVWAPI